MQEIIEKLEIEKKRVLDLRLLLLNHSRSGAHNRLVGATDALNQAITDIKNEMKGNKNETNIQTYGGDRQPFSYGRPGYQLSQSPQLGAKK